MMVQTYKIVVAGADKGLVNGFVQTISEPMEPTTVKMIFGRCTLAEDVIVYLFGLLPEPDLAREVLPDGALGIVLLADADAPHDLPVLRDMMRDVMGEYAELPWVVGVVHDADSLFSPEDIGLALDPPMNVMLGSCDPFARQSVKEALMAVAVMVGRRDVDSVRLRKLLRAY